MAKATKGNKIKPEVVEVKEVVVKDANEIVKDTVNELVKEVVVEESNYKPSSFVVKEIMIQKGVSFDEALAILKKNNK